MTQQFLYKRREFITLLGGAVAAWPIAARAQQPAMPVIGFLRNTLPDAHLMEAFRTGLTESGYIEGRNVTVEYRWTEGGQLTTAAADLVRRQVNVIATGGLVATLAAKAATAAIPIVFATGDDPVQLGLVSSLNRPGGNITGASFLLVTVTAKRVELLRELVPSATVIGFLVDPHFPTADVKTREAESAARAHGFELLILNASTEGEIETAFATLLQRRGGALVVNADEFFTSHAKEIAALAVRHRVPTSFQLREAVEAGGLMSYGASFAASMRGAS
jgi:putative ABC transport system substrate-binding protein